MLIQENKGRFSYYKNLLTFKTMATKKKPAKKAVKKVVKKPAKKAKKPAKKGKK